MGRPNLDRVAFKISIPRELREEMATADNVNWSSVATEAFRRKLIERKAEMSVRTKEDVFERLKASEQMEADEAKALGHRLGREWAESTASISQLRRIRSYQDHCDEGVNPWEGGKWQDGSVMPAAWRFVKEVFPPYDDPHEFRDGNEEFWLSVQWDSVHVGEDDVINTEPSGDYVKEFAKGALEVLDEYDRSKSASGS